MARFKFSLEGVLRVRRLAEELAQGKYGAKLAECESLRQEIVKAQREIEEFRSEWTYERWIDPHQLIHRNCWLEHLNAECWKRQEELREQKRLLEILRKELAKASQEKKAIEKLKEKKFEEFKAEIKKKEQHFTDEMASVRFFRSEKNIEI